MALAKYLAPALLLIPGLAAAQPAPAPPPSAAHGNEVAGVTVPGGPPPNVTATYPAEGASAPPGVMVLKFTFDQAMDPRAWAFGQVADAAFPHCLGKPRLLHDKKSFALLCTVAGKQAYAIQLNPDPRFAADGGRSARPFVLHFATSELGETRDLHTALDRAGLKDEDEPIMDWDDAGKGVSESPPAPAG
ncbi:hypothetical protein ACO2Q3_04520 [Caulobacter sp. KR2-114]|uniref:hypothetical protein n=1 Tax=Caulobacter sp. KR2-114 TaxID=3400912 RepID=UPI003C0EFB4D